MVKTSTIFLEVALPNPLAISMLKCPCLLDPTFLINRANLSGNLWLAFGICVGCSGVKKNHFGFNTGMNAESARDSSKLKMHTDALITIATLGP